MVSKIYTKRLDIPMTPQQFEEIENAFSIAKAKDPTLVLRPWCRALLLDASTKVVRKASSEKRGADHANQESGDLERISGNPGIERNKRRSGKK
jgi:hypothetical protein